MGQKGIGAINPTMVRLGNIWQIYPPPAKILWQNIRERVLSLILTRPIAMISCNRYRVRMPMQDARQQRQTSILGAEQKDRPVNLYRVPLP